MGCQFESRHFPRLAPLGISDQNCRVADERDHVAFWRPHRFLRHHIANAPRCSALDRPKPQSRFLPLVRQLADQELRVIGRQIKYSRVIKRCGSSLDVPAFHRSLHQVPAGHVSHHEINSASVRDQFPPRIHLPRMRKLAYCHHPWFGPRPESNQHHRRKPHRHRKNLPPGWPSLKTYGFALFGLSLAYRTIRVERQFKRFALIFALDPDCRHQRSRLYFHDLHWRNKTIPTSRNSLDKHRVFRVVIQRCPQFHQRRIQAAVELNKRSFRPDSPSQIITRQHFAGRFQQQGQNSKGLFLQFDGSSLPTQRPLFQVCFKQSKAVESAILLSSCIHWEPSSLRVKREYTKTRVDRKPYLYRKPRVNGS